MKRIVAALAACLALLVCAQAAMATPTVLDNGYLRVGVDDAGGLINWNTFTGIKYDAKGTGKYGDADFLTPGSPFQFYSVGYGGGYVVANAGAPYNPLGATTTALGPTGAVTTNGLWNSLGFSQSMYLDPSRPNVLVVDVTLKNKSKTTLTDLVFATGFDPDQDYTYGLFDTQNTKVSNGLVSAAGKLSGLNISLFTDSEYTHDTSISWGWETNPYSLLTGFNDGDGDNTIALAFNLGDLAPGRSLSLEYEVRVTPIPGAVWLLGSGLLGLIGLRRKFC